MLRINCGLVIEEALFVPIVLYVKCFPLLPLLSDYTAGAFFFSFGTPGIFLFPRLSKSVGSSAMCL